MSTLIQRVSHPLDFSCQRPPPDPLQGHQKTRLTEDDGMQMVFHSFFGQVELTDVIFNHIFRLLIVHDLARLRTVCKEFSVLGDGYVLNYLKSYSLMKIVANYGFEPTSDLRNLIIVQKAYEACLCEEGSAGLNLNTLHDKFAVAEDRNLIKLFLRYMNTSFSAKTITYVKNHPAIEEFLEHNPKLNVCCISQVDDIAGTATAIRIWLKTQTSIELQVLYLGKLPQIHDVYMSVIPPEIEHFSLKVLLANKNTFRLVSRNVGAAVEDKIDLRYNQLGALPDELNSRNNQIAYSTEGNPSEMVPPKGSPRTKLINRNTLNFYALGSKLQIVMLDRAVNISKGKLCRT